MTEFFYISHFLINLFLLILGSRALYQNYNRLMDGRSNSFFLAALVVSLILRETNETFWDMMEVL